MQAVWCLRRRIDLYGLHFADSSGQGGCHMVPVDPRLRVVAKFISMGS